MNIGLYVALNSEQHAVDLSERLRPDEVQSLGAGNDTFGNG